MTEENGPKPEGTSASTVSSLDQARWIVRPLRDTLRMHYDMLKDSLQVGLVEHPQMAIKPAELLIAIDAEVRVISRILAEHDMVSTRALLDPGVEGIFTSMEACLAGADALIDGEST